MITARPDNNRSMCRLKAVDYMFHSSAASRIERKDNSMKKIMFSAAVLFCFAGSWLFAADDKTAPATEKAAPAADKTADTKAVDAKKTESKLAGKWEGKFTRPDGTEMKFVYNFKIDGDKLTGTIESPRGEREISDGKVNGDEMSFEVQSGDNVTKYQGKLVDNKIDMKSQGPRGDREITLTRLVDINGRWVTKFTRPDGDDGEGMELTFTFKVDGEKLTGKVESPMGDIELTNGKVKGEEFSFDVDVNGNVIGHDCKISGDEIKMKIKGFEDEGAEKREFILKRVKEEKK
jgi:hypothetical protein